MAATILSRLDGSTFDAVVGAGTGLVAVEFGAKWCGACRVMAPALEAAAQELGGRVGFWSIDADANPDVVVRFGVRGLPTVLLFRDGELVDRIIGAQPRDRLIARIQSAIATTSPRKAP